MDNGNIIKDNMNHLVSAQHTGEDASLPTLPSAQ